MSHWSDDYIGIPFRDGGRHDDQLGRAGGLDCWGLLRLVYAERLGVMLPAWSGQRASDSPAVAACIGTGLGDWQQLPAPVEFAGVLLRKGRDPCHVGVAVGHRFFLHVDTGISAAIEALQGIAWRHRVVGFYQYRAGG